MMLFSFIHFPKTAVRVGVVLAAMMIATATQAIDYFVDQNKTTNSGMSGSGQLGWSDAFITLEEALNIANGANGDIILVADGTYTPNDLLGTGNRLLTFSIPNRVVIKGGYEGENESSFMNRDPKAFLTILSGDFLIGDPNGEDSDFGNRNVNSENWHDATRLDNAITVVTAQGVSEGTRIEGFTIQRGAGATLLGGTRGGGMSIIDSAIDVVNCTFRYNATGFPDPDPSEGRSGEGGGAAVNGAFFISLTEIYFSRFINCTFHDNVASRGGGLAVVNEALDDSKVKVINCLFYDNRAIEMRTAVLQPADGSGGAIFVFGKDMFGNRAEAEITNCTVVNNWAQNSMGGFFLWNVDDMFESLIQNSVFWNNDSGFGASSPGGEIGFLPGEDPGKKTFLKVRYTDVEGNLTPSPGSALTVENLMDLDPLFVDKLNKDFRLTATSPVLDAGHPQTSSIPLIPPDDFDLDGDGDFGELTPGLDLRLREFDSDNDGTAQVDMGMFEFTKCCADVASSSLDYTVNVTDLLAMLAAWGPNPGHPADFTGLFGVPDGEVDVFDLLALLAAWGECTSICDYSNPPQQPASITSTQYPSLAAYGGQYGPVSDTWTSTSQTGLRLASDEFKPVSSA